MEILEQDAHFRPGSQNLDVVSLRSENIIHPSILKDSYSNITY